MSKHGKRRRERRQGALPIVGIEASASTEELSVREAARTRVRFTGRGRVDTRRTNLPPRGAESGRVYRRATAATRIRALSPSVERARGEPDEDDGASDTRDRSGS